MARDHVISGRPDGPAAVLASWCCSLGELALACAGSYAADEAARLRELAALVAAAPEGRATALPKPDHLRIEVLIEAGAGISAALELLGTGQVGYLLSCGGEGRHIASVIIPGNAEETTATGDTAALALVGALAQALAEQTGEGAPLPERRVEPRGLPN